MSRNPFRIVPQGDVGKTALLYKGDEEDLEALANRLDSIKSSEVYPSFEDDFHCAIHFYDASEHFQSELRNYCERNLTGLNKQATTKQTRTVPVITIKWIVIGLLVLFFGYFFIIPTIANIIKVIGEAS
jgi:hypothetical protein